MFAPFSETIENLLGSHPSHPQLAALIEHGPGCVYIVDAQTFTLLYLAEKARSLLPPSFFSLLKENADWRERVHVNDRFAFNAAVNALQPNGPSQKVAYRLATSKKNDTLPLSDELIAITSQSGETIAYLGRFEDDSFRIQAMDTLTRSSWQGFANEVTRRFMHDFNNMMAGIYSLSELYAVPGSDPKTMVEAMVHIRDNSIRAQNITREIRALGSMNESSSSFSDIKTLITEQKNHIRALLPKRAEFFVNLPEESLPCRIDSSAFNQAMLHLAANARDAAPEDTTLLIRAAIVTEDEKKFAKIEFTDNGAGIKERIIDRVQEPFFTTKDPQKNPGLGLFIVKSFADSSGGRLEIESQEGKGTSVFLTLPLSNLAENISAPAAKPATLRKSAKEKKRLTLLIYAWEDITRHPLISALRDESWKYRIHIDTLQLTLDINDMRDELDGILIFKSSLDEKAEPLVRELANTENIPPIALITFGDSLDAVPTTIADKCALVALANSGPKSLVKKLFNAFQQSPA